MKGKHISVICLLLVVGLLFWWQYGQTSHPVVEQSNALQADRNNILASPSNEVVALADSVAAAAKREVQERETMEQGKNEWRTPIEFYGKVVDENTNPVSNAQVHFVWTDLSMAGNSEKQTASDVNGLFSLREVSGKHLMATVSKEGYYAYQPFGVGFFYAGENQNFIPDAANPVIFRLKKKGVAEPLIAFENDFLISKDGKPVDVDLIKGKPTGVGQGGLRVECWTDDQGKAPGLKYDWKCQISVPGGGIEQSTNQLDFKAPLDGYQASDEINMPASMANGWGRSAKRNYFLKLGDGNYARVSFEMIAGGGHFFHLASFLNPSGSRNLEFDPNTVVQPGQ
jgi:hypothetical protein